MIHDGIPGFIPVVLSRIVDRLAEECRSFGALGNTRRNWCAVSILLSKKWSTKAGGFGRTRFIKAADGALALVLEVILMIGLFATTEIVLWKKFVEQG